MIAPYRAFPVLVALATFAALPASLGAQGRVPVARTVEGGEVWIDSASVVRLSGYDYVAKVVTRLPAPVTPPSGPAFDRAVESRIVDCAGAKEHTRVTTFFRGDSLVSFARHEPGEPAPVTAERRAEFDALCGALAGAFGALPLPLAGHERLRGPERQPELLNRRDLAAALTREYPPELRASVVSGQVTLVFRLRADGTVHEATADVMEATDLAFVAPALRVLPVMRFRPAAIGGTAVPVWISVPVMFTPPRARQ